MKEKKCADDSRVAESKARLTQHLISACSEGNADLVRRLLKKGSDPNGREGLKAGMCPLVAAVGRGSLKIVKMLLRGGADPNSASFGGGDLNGSALEVACKRGRVDIAKLLVAHGAEINKQGYWPPLKSAISHGQLKSVRFLLRLGAEFKSGWLTQGTLHKNSVKIMEELVRAGADVNHHEYDSAADVTLRGRVPLHNTAERGLSAETEFLLRAGADPNRQLQYAKDTPLILAAQSGNIEVIRMLLEAGADITVTGWKGETAERRARVFGRHDAAKLLRNYVKDRGINLLQTSKVAEALKVPVVRWSAKIVIPRSRWAEKSDIFGASDFVDFVHGHGHPEWIVLAVEAPLADALMVYESCFPVAESRQSVPIVSSQRNYKNMPEWVPFVQPVNSKWAVLLRVVGFPIGSHDIIQAIDDTELISKKLRTRGLSFFGEDTAGAMQCELFEKGKSLGTESWKHQGAEADGLFKKLGLYVPACYAQKCGNSTRLAVWPSSKNRIARAALVLPKA
jgi:ankyrin repeat protein